MANLLTRWWAALCVLTVISFASPARGDAPTLTDHITAVLVAEPRHLTDKSEGDVDRETRMRDIAAAINSGVQHVMCIGAWKSDPDCEPRWKGSRRELTAALITVARHESRFALLVQQSRCSEMPKGQQCDHGRARGLWQCWATACPHTWQTEPGSDAELRTSAWEAGKLLAGFYTYCRTLDGTTDGWELAYSAFAGRGCRPWIGAKNRRYTMQRFLAELNTLPVLTATPTPAEPAL